LRLALLVIALATPLHAALFDWPTENRALLEGRPQDFFMYVNRNFEGEETKPWEGGSFGFVRGPQRQDGDVIYTTLHEGIDIAPVRRDASGNPLDEIRASADGIVVHTSREAGASNYGRYVVIEHKIEGCRFYTLYAHLASIRGDLRVGTEISEGHVLGILGRSSSGTDPIPQDRAHLHFEIGLRLSENFDRWYEGSPHRRQPNAHGNFNGMNLAGFDPLQQVLLRPRVDLHTVVNDLPAALVVVARSRQAPDFVRRYPQLVTGTSQGSIGWRIEFTWHGMPKRWTPILQGTAGVPAAGWRIERLSSRPDLRRLLEQRQMLVPGKTEPGETLRRTMGILLPPS
jgi:murein DD-endopeptidase MepM/ murein hydrolase activator NlpD